MKTRSALAVAGFVVSTLCLVALPASKLTPPAFAQASKPPAGAKVYFVNVKDGETVTNPVRIVFGLSGMGVAPAGLQGEATANTGHHHLLIDSTLSGEALKQPIPADDKHIHFGKGQTETSVTLAPGKHTFQLVLGNWTHVPFDPPLVSPVITLTVK